MGVTTGVGVGAAVGVGVGVAAGVSVGVAVGVDADTAASAINDNGDIAGTYTDAWGVDPRGSGKRMWFELIHRQPAAEAAQGS